jgi:superfamily I DNA/RNA helicase
VPEELLPLVRGIATDEELEQAQSQLPQEAYEALFLLAAGYSVDEVFLEVDKKNEEARHDTQDFKGALENDDTRRRFYVVESAKDLAELLSAPLDQWRVFLHPKQRRLVSMTANGPVRVLGGAGTGKTVVAMHRAKHLAEEVFKEPGDRVLFTTFTRNLATDILANLRKICSVEALARMEVINLDAFVANFLKARGYPSTPVFGAEENDCWDNALNVAPEDLDLSKEFLRGEWEQVIQAQDLQTLDAYQRAARLGRGTRMSREQKAKAWRVFEEYREQLRLAGRKEFVDLIRDARQLAAHAPRPAGYRAVVVDEAQDMSPEAFRLLRALVPAGPNDIFIVGDAHQRIYRYRASLGKCGIDIRGRGRRLRLNYRTTEEIRRFAVALVEGRPVDDLDGGTDDARGELSLTRGGPPEVRSFPTMLQEQEEVAKHIKKLLSDGAAAPSVCLVARTQKLLETFEQSLTASGVETYRVKRDMEDRRDRPGVRVATLHRVKGLEFDHMAVVAATEGVIPLEKALSSAGDPAEEADVEMAERALLYVAVTRARKSALITSHGTPSRFLVRSKA